MNRFPAPNSILLVMLVLLLLVSSLGLVASTHQVRDGYAQLQSLELQRWQLQEQYTRLLLEMNTWAAPHRVGRIASDTLSMTTPDVSLSYSVVEP
ncbi:cell division protein FtsL [Luminiphilus sp.]|jgi:cell division protein FtsL|nr:cell division protein FtsL [Luminiphilus sp.]MDA8678795.1 cell division protein FtsL [Luminiphilus sp.]